MSAIPYRCALKIIRNLKFPKTIGYRNLYSSACRYRNKNKYERFKATGNTVFEPYEPGFDVETENFKIPSERQFKDAMRTLREELDKWIEEKKALHDNDPITEYRHGEVIRVFSFGRDTDPSTWTVLSDQDEDFGFSTCQFTTSKNGCALFHGNLSTQVREDGVSYRSGFCAIRAPRPVKSFLRKSYYDWSQYTHLVLRVRGDGRSYMITLGASQYFDTTWFNSHCHALYTRGGPYWQISKIPFSKFILAHKGYIQDKQWEPQMESISGFGITLMDKVDGPFNLEIDYVGLEVDLMHDEVHAYEMYKHESHLGDC